MSREIKLRAWLKDDKRMVEVEEIHFRHQLIEYYDGNYDDCWLEKDFDKIELMQYTGLKDKNGKEIYEGDIIDIHQTVNGQSIFVIEVTNTGLVIPRYAFDKNYKYEYNIRELLEFDEYDKEIEVIGNVWENRELLEENYE